MSFEESTHNTTDNDPTLRASTSSPTATLYNLLPIRPDITIFCELCDCHVDLRALNEHRLYHRCLTIMRYKGGTRPGDIGKLMQRRRNILRRLKSSTDSDNPLDPVELQKVNDAYEFLKADLEDTYEAYRRVSENVYPDVQGLGLNCSADSILAVGICSHGNQRWKNAMEDTRVFQDYFGNDAHKCFFAIYDGHHGTFAAEMASRELHRALLREMVKFDPRTKCSCVSNLADGADTSLGDYCPFHSRSPSKATNRAIIYDESTAMIEKIIAECEEKLVTMQMNSSETPRKKEKRYLDHFSQRITEAFKKAHHYTDLLLMWGRDEHSKVRWSGCSTLTCVIQDRLETGGDSVDEDKAPESAENVLAEEKTEAAEGGEEEKEEKEIVLKQYGTIHLANSGNVHAVLVRGNRPYRITRDHTAKNAKERARIIKEGGTISDSECDMRVNGIMAATRGLGNHGDSTLKKLIISTPHTTSVKIDQFAQFLVLASNGVWEVFSEKEAASILLQMIPSNHIPAPSRLSTSMNYLLGDESSLFSRSQSVLTAEVTAANEMNYYNSNTKPSSAATSRGGVSRKASTVISAPEEKPTEREDVTHKSYSLRTSGGGVGNQTESNNPGDLFTEVGSQFDNMSEDNDYDDDGNEADLDTYTDFTLPGNALEQPLLPTREEIHRDFARAMSERLTQAALLAGARDNITIQVILFPGCGLL